MLRICLGLFLAAAAWAQPAFEVASVKPVKYGAITHVEGGPGSHDPGRFRATSIGLRGLVWLAYHLDEVSGPAWMDVTEFDVVANVPPGTTIEQFREMLQNLLAERFRMRVHHETKLAAVYELTAAKNGPRLKPAAQGDGADDFVPGSGPRRADRDSFPILPPGRTNRACQYGPDGAHCTYRMTSLDLLVRALSGPDVVDRRVVDKTGLTEKYDFTLYFRPMNAPENEAPDIATALQEQLGLKLAPSKASIDMLVIDHAEMPTEN